MLPVDRRGEEPVHSPHSERRRKRVDEQEAQAPNVDGCGELESELAQDGDVVGALEAEPGAEVRADQLAFAHLPHFLEVVQEPQVVQVDGVLSGFLRVGADAVQVRRGRCPARFVHRRQPPAARGPPCRTRRR